MGKLPVPEASHKSELCIKIMGISFDQSLSVSMSNLVMFLFSVFYLYLGMGYLLVMSSSYSIPHKITGNIK